ncbi:MAG: acyl-CoA thioesterase [Candidatus Sericytochromatia bacterium]
MHITEIKISETWLDAFGHVNHARYLELYEQARWDWLAEKGLDLPYIQRTGVGPVILRVEVDYRRELLPRQQVRITTQTVAYEKKIFVLQQQMLLPDGELSSALRVTGGLMDMRARKLIVPPQDWLQAFDLARPS